MESKLKTFLNDLKEKELYIPLVLFVIAAIIYHLVVNTMLIGQKRKALQEENEKLEKRVEAYWPLKENEEKNLELINTLTQKLSKKYELTEAIYLKSRSDLEIFLKTTIAGRLKAESKSSEQFDYYVRTEGQGSKVGNYLRYRAKIDLTGSLADIHNLMRELQRRDNILIEIKELSIELEKYLPNGTVLLDSVFMIAAYQEIEGKKKEKDSELGSRRRPRMDF